jgi:hypothetical protein
VIFYGRLNEKFSTASPKDCPGPECRKKWRIPKSFVFPAIGPNLATFPTIMGATGQRMDSVNLKYLTMFCRTVLTSSSGLRIKGCVSCWKEDSKSYTLGVETHKYGHGLIFYPKNHTHVNIWKWFSTVALMKNSRLRIRKTVRDQNVVKYGGSQIRHLPCYRT